LWEVMNAYWPGSDSDPAATPAMREFGVIWRATPKVVFSSTLSGPLSWNARLASSDPAAELARIRTETDGDLELGGPTIAAEFIRRDLVDEYGLVVHPVVLGAGRPFFPPDAGRLSLRLIDTKRFTSGVVYLGYERDRS
jgi:dihydrofolate reductase